MLLEEFEDTKGVIRIEPVNQRRTDNTMANRKRTKGQKGQILIYKTFNKDRVTRTPLYVTFL
jgi:hypothetical protein